MGQPYVVLPATGQGLADQWNVLGSEHHMASKFPQAEACYRRALSFDPCNATATMNLGILYSQIDRLAEGLLCADRAVLFDPDSPLVWVNRAFLYLEAGFVETALESADRAVALTPDRPGPDADGLTESGYQAARQVRGMLCGVMARAGEGLAYWREMVAVDPKNTQAGINLCFAQTLTDATPAEFLEARRQWRANNGYKGRHWPHDNDRAAERPLRVGYVSGDFKTHSAAMIFSNVLLNHDKAQVLPYLYSCGKDLTDADDMTKRFRECGTWREIYGKSDEDADDLIRRDGIDILVDLSGHTNPGASRLPLFTRQPAPVQITAWGFAVGTGLPEIDAFFADPITVPTNERQFYAERIYDLPCIVTYRPPTEYGLTTTSPPPIGKNGVFTFGCFCRYEKISDEYLAAVREILQEVPGSRMHFKDHAFKRPHSIQRVWNALNGIDKKRIFFGGTTSHPEHMLSLQQVDLFLDPFPHSGGTGALEMLYMGVPIITRYGANPAGRLGASMLTAMKRPEWIARSIPEYVKLAVSLGNDPHPLGKVRETLGAEFLASPIVAGYREAVEAAYRELWKEWAAKDE